jgi:hypothetical protein
MLGSLRRMSSKVVLRGRSFHGGCWHWNCGCVVGDGAQCLRMLSAARGAYAQLSRLLPRVAGAPRTCLLLATWRARFVLQVCEFQYVRPQKGSSRFFKKYVVVDRVLVCAVCPSARCRITMNPSSLGWPKRKSKQSGKARESTPFHCAVARDGRSRTCTWASVLM